MIHLLVFALLSVLLGASFLNLLPADNWLLEVNRSFGGYYLVIHIMMLPASVLLLLYTNRAHELRLLMSTHILMIVFYALPIYSLYIKPTIPEGDLSCDRLYTTTFLQVTTLAELNESRLLVEEVHPDILFIVAHEPAKSRIKEILASYADIRETKGVSGSLLMIASRVQLGQVKLSDLGDEFPGALIVDLPGERVPHLALALIASGDALNDRDYARNSLIMRRSSAALRSISEPVLAATSLRMTPYSKLYRVFREDNVFNDLFEGEGLVRTWSGRSQFIRFHYDQFFAKGMVLSAGVTTVDSSVLDHLPIQVKFRACK